jgi:acetyl-CoA acyltransferase 2
MSETLVFLAGKRTPFGANGGSLKDVNPSELSLTAAKAALEQAHVKPEEIDHVVWGNVLHSAADSIYTPRHTGLRAGIPESVPALGINRLCGSGFQVVVEAFHQMLAGDTKIALVGGVENMSMAPYVMRGARFGLKMGNAQLEDSMTESLTDSYTKAPMGITAENLAVKYGITREQCDAFALLSQKRWAAANEQGHFKNEIVAYEIASKKGTISFAVDEHPRPQSTPEALAKLAPVFKKDGVVTAGNASGICDGAAALVLTTAEFAQAKGLRPLAKLVQWGVAGVDPSIMGIGPAPAIKNALARAELKLGDIDRFEVNEAFAPQYLAVEKELGLDRARTNVNGGAIAMGHPLGASGARITAHLVYELARSGGRYAVGSACIGGGQGIAVVLEKA